MAMIGLIARPFAMDMTAQAGDSASAAAFPKTNLANNDFGRVCRSTSGVIGSYTFVIDLLSARGVDCLALLWHNLRAGDTIRFRAGSTAARAAAGNDYDSGAVAAMTGATKRDPAPLLSKCMHTPAATQTWRYWAVVLTVVGTNHTAGYVQASRLFVGTKAIFAIGAQKADLSAVDMNTRITTEVGEERASEDQNLIRPVAALDLKYAKETEMAEVLGQYALGLGVSRPMLLTPDAAGAYLQDTLVFGRPDKVISLSSEFYDVWSFQALVPSIGP